MTRQLLPVLMISACCAFLMGCPPEEDPVEECESNSDCEGGEVCEDSECVGVITECDDDSDCEEGESCDVGECVPVTTCTAYFEGWYVDANGACAFGSASGCEDPFDFATEPDCEASLVDPPVVCPEDGFADNAEWDDLPVGTRCEYGQECCCGECFPSLVCERFAEGPACYYTDACFVPQCEECRVDSDCPEDWQYCNGGECADSCHMMDCQQGYICTQGECIPDGTACEANEDCPPNQQCLAGECGPIDTCDAWWEGYYTDRGGNCVYGSGSGCDNPFPYATLEACQNANGTLCPDDPFAENDGARFAPIPAEIVCEYGEECCCGECYPSLVCTSTGDGDWACYNTDACMVPSCGDCEANSDCNEGYICLDGTCTDACATIRCAAGFSCSEGECIPNGPSCDFDGDGYDGPYRMLCTNNGLPGDCNDQDEHINPGVAEVCGDRIDNNCNGEIDEGCDTPAAQCAAGGGDWVMMNDGCGDMCIDPTNPPLCTLALQVGCDCGPGSCWDGEECIRGPGANDHTTGACATDSDCAEGQVCEPGLGGDGTVCVDGCHEDSQCDDGQQCTQPQCFTTPCPGYCEGNASGECSSDADCREGNVCETALSGDTVCVSGCRDNDGCSDHQTCQEVLCVTTPCPAQCFDACTAMLCGPGHECRHGECVPVGNPSLCDFDGDGYMGNYLAPCPDLLPGGDCNDQDASVHPGAPDVCGDDTDNDCDGEIDETCAVPNCYDLTCDPDTQYCSVGWPGVAPDPNNLIPAPYTSCQPIPTDCDAADVCDCLAPGANDFIAGDCRTDANSGLTTVSVYYP